MPNCQWDFMLCNFVLFNVTLTVSSSIHFCATMNWLVKRQLPATWQTVAPFSYFAVILMYANYFNICKYEKLRKYLSHCTQHRAKTSLYIIYNHNYINVSMYIMKL